MDDLLELDWGKITTGLLGASVLTGVIWGPIGVIVQGLIGLAHLVIGLLPDAGPLGLAVPTGFIYAFDVLNTFLPLAEALAFVGVLVTAAMAVMTFRLAVTIYHLIPKPGIGT